MLEESALLSAEIGAEPLLVEAQTLARRARVRLLEGSTATPAAGREVDSYGLTERECQVAMQCVQGRVTKEIARALSLSPYTVQDHLKSIFDKSTARSRRALLARALGT